jgi:sugar phosphate isomerase/epimerase
VRLAISNIAWPAAADATIADVLRELGVSAIEVAPTMVWPHPLEAGEADAKRYREWWERRGIRIVAMQALLFGRPDLLVFADPEQHEQTLEYLRGIFRLAAWLGAGPLVFGSPKNRRAAHVPPSARLGLAAEFFRAAGDAAAAEGVVLCIEPNPREYDCDFVNTVAEARELVTAVASPGFALNLDAAAMTLAGDAPAEVTLAAPRHFHISEPWLAPIGTGGVDHDAFARALRVATYTGWTSIEMRATAEGGDPAAAEHVRRAVLLARERYGESV